MTGTARLPPSTRFSMGVIISITLGQMGPITQPFQVGGLIDGAHVSSAQAGSLMALQMILYSIALLGVARLANRIGLAVIALSGIALSVFSFGVLYATSSLPILYVASGLGGLGQGAVFAAALAGGAATTNPERLYGVGATIAIVVAGCFMAGFPLAQPWLGARGVFAALCILLLSLSPTLLGLASRPPANSSVPASSLRAPGVWALFGMLILFGVGAGAIYTFAERVGVSLGLAGTQIGFIFMISTIVGAAGSTAAAWIGLRWGRRVPLLTSLLSTGLACLLLAQAWDSFSYCAGVFAFQFTYTAAFPFQIGAAAGLDARGRIAALSGGVHFLAWAGGAQLGGVLASWASYHAIGVFSLAACALACLTVPRVAAALQHPGTVSGSPIRHF